MHIEDTPLRLKEANEDGILGKAANLPGDQFLPTAIYPILVYAANW
jgi:hypothetical protein